MKLSTEKEENDKETVTIGLGLFRVLSHFQQYFSYIVSVSFIGGGNQSTQRKPPICRKSLTNYIT